MILCTLVTPPISTPGGVHSAGTPVEKRSLEYSGQKIGLPTVSPVKYENTVATPVPHRCHRSATGVPLRPDWSDSGGNWLKLATPGKI